MNETCLNCGHDRGLHHYQTMQCPRGGEAPIGKRQEWLDSTFTSDNSDTNDRVHNLEKRVAELERQIKKIQEMFQSTG